jgi:RNA polymerase-binding transcription factor DksA
MTPRQPDVHSALTRELHARLDSARASFRERLRGLRDSAEATADTALQPGDSGDALHDERDVETALGSQFKSRLEAIEAALQRIDRGWSGQCASCERSIPFERLMVVPGTEHCVSCQEQLVRRRG